MAYGYRAAIGLAALTLVMSCAGSSEKAGDLLRQIYVGKSTDVF